MKKYHRKKPSLQKPLFLLSMLVVLVVFTSHTTFFIHAQQTLEQSLVCPSPIMGEQGFQMIPCNALNAYDPYAPKPTKAPPSSGSGGSPSSAGGVSGSCGAVLSWAQKINDALVCSGHGCDYLPTQVKSSCDTSSKNDSSGGAGQYWCTLLVFDSYNIAGLKVAKNPAVINMHAWWKTASGFKYIDGNNIKDVKPGYAVFTEDPGSGQKQHKFLVKTITVDSHGNGSVVSLEANVKEKSKTYPVSGWKIQNTVHAVQGFGGK